MTDEKRIDERGEALNDEELEACGISPDMVRLSCGIESTEDLIADVAQALEQI